MPINIGSTAKLRNKLFKRKDAEYDVVSSGRARLLTSVTCLVFVTRYSRATLVVKGCDKKIFSSSCSTVEIFVPTEMPTKRVFLILIS